MLVPLLSALLFAAAPATATSHVPQAATPAQAVDGASYWSLPLEEVPWLDATGDREASLSDLEVRTRNGWDRPYARVVLAGGGEAYVAVIPSDGDPETVPPIRLVARAEAGGAVTGTVIGGEDYRSAYRLTFELPRALASSDARDAFLTGRAWHHAGLAGRDIPGAAWFRHGVEQAPDTVAPSQLRLRGDVGAEGELVETLELFSGGRAAAENLQLDRLLPPAVERTDDGAPEPPVPVDAIPGITIEQFDWTPHLEGTDPAALDPLLAWIPHDQHVLLTPSFGAFVTLVDELEARAGPLVSVMETTSTSAHSQRMLEEQLTLSLDGMARLLGPALIERVALTGGDLYLRTGTDVTLLFECRDVAPVARHVRARHAEVAAADPSVERVSEGSVEGVLSAFGRVSSYFTVEGNVLILSNSRASLERTRAAHDDRNLATLPETRFFRHRYPSVDAAGREETAFLLISDPTIRRWCGARWRLGASRRLRALAALLAVQAAHAHELAAGVEAPRTLTVADERFPDLGTLTLTAAGVHSSKYGASGRLTPIVELELDRVPAAEARLYERWRDGYARNWSGAFDPIAARIVVTPEVLEADVSVLPLIDDTDYRELRDWSGNARLSPQDADPHPGTLFHFALAIDPDSPEVVDFQEFLSSFATGEAGKVLGWMSGSLSLYADEDEIWDLLLDSEDPEQALEDLLLELNELPVALTIGSKSPLKLAGWMAAVRGFVDGASPGLTQWSTREDDEGNTYVRVGSDDLTSDDEHVLYATLPEALVVALEDETLLASMRRFRARREAPDSASRQAWLGESAALTVSRRGLALLAHVLGDSLGEEAQRRTYANLPILNEWKRLFPDQDPVVVHARVFGEELRCAAGGSFVWDDTWRTMASTVLGHPADRELGSALPAVVGDLERIEAGLSFELDGLRARLRASR